MKRLLKVWKNEPLFSAFLLVIVIALIGAGTAFAADTVAKSSLIGEEAAKKFAWLDAGVKEKHINRSSVELQKNGFRYIYDVTFTTDEASYAYKVRSSDGTILDRQKEVTAQLTEPEKKPKKLQTQKIYISVDKAKKKALKQAGIAEDEVTFSKAKLEKDDGVALYDVEFYTADFEYEYEIEAYSGRILESSVEAAENAAVPARTDSTGQSSAAPAQQVTEAPVQTVPQKSTDQTQDGQQIQKNANAGNQNTVLDDDDSDDRDDDDDDNDGDDDRDDDDDDDNDSDDDDD